MNDYPYYFAWKNNPKRATLHNRPLKVLARGAMNSALVEFENGQREVISRNALRRRTKIAVDQPSADDMRRDLINKSNPTAYFKEQKRLATE